MLIYTNGKYFRDGAEISEAEYDVLCALVREKTEYAAKVLAGEISIDAVPAEIREAVQTMVENRKAEPDDIDEAEAFDIIFGGAE